jgi:hypothetical protein
MKNIEPNWLRLTEEVNAIDYLEQISYFLDLVNTNNFAWKWVIFAFHGALYSFAICAIKGTSKHNVTYYDKNGRERLISFPTAIERCQQEEYFRSRGSQYLQLSTQEKESISELSDFRNDIEYYIPKGWSINVNMLPKIALDILSVIGFLVLETKNYQDYSDEQEEKIRNLMNDIKQKLEHQ